MGNEMNKQGEVDLIAKTIVGEARSEIWEGKLAIANVILNRNEHKGWFGSSIAKIINKPSQFSCWNANDPNRKISCNPEKYVNNDVWKECKVAARLVYNNEVVDNTMGATHYLTISAYNRIQKAYTKHWVFNLVPTITIGNHIFFREK